MGSTIIICMYSFKHYYYHYNCYIPVLLILEAREKGCSLFQACIGTAWGSYFGSGALRKPQMCANSKIQMGLGLDSFSQNNLQFIWRRAFQLENPTRASGLWVRISGLGLA